MAILHISCSVQVPAYEMTDKLCRGCGKSFRGFHWTKPPCASQRREWIFEGRVLGWCEGCITAEETRRLQQEEAQRRERERPVSELRRPVRTLSGADEPPF